MAVLRVAALADVHYRRDHSESHQALYREISQRSDVLLLCGDLTDLGLPEEAEIVVHELRAASVPVLAVLGNHDFQSGKVSEVRGILEAGGVKVLDGETAEISGVGFAGAKGFCGGFGRRTLEPWGEPTIKSFVQETVEESLKLDSALARLRMPHRVVMLHYSPIAATVEGEPLEIYPFLGSSRLEDPINRHGCDAVFHGHAHHGQLEGRTQTGVPVYNVSMSLLRQANADQPPYRMLEIPLEE